MIGAVLLANPYTAAPLEVERWRTVSFEKPAEKMRGGGGCPWADVRSGRTDIRAARHRIFALTKIARL